MAGDGRSSAPAAGGGAASWVGLSEGLISGVHHALNNRMAALRAVGQVVEADLPPDHPLAGALATELQRLEETVGLLSLLGEDDRGPEPVQVADVVADAVRLFEMHHSLRDLPLYTEIDPGLLPVLTRPPALLRGLLLLLALGARAKPRDLRLTAEGDERVVRITVVPGEPRDQEENDGEPRAISVADLEKVFEEAGGTLSAETDGGERRLQATVLTLPEARRREGG